MAEAESTAFLNDQRPRAQVSGFTAASQQPGHLGRVGSFSPLLLDPPERREGEERAGGSVGREGRMRREGWRKGWREG